MYMQVGGWLGQQSTSWQSTTFKKKINVGYTCTSRILNMYCSALWKQKIESYTKNLTDAPKEISQNRAGAWFWVCLYKVQ